MQRSTPLIVRDLNTLATRLKELEEAG